MKRSPINWNRYVPLGMDGIKRKNQMATMLGVGIGGDFEQVAYLSKKALCRDLGTHNENEFYAELEKELLEKVNELDIGPQGFGGKTTALGLNIEFAPTHIAGLPVAVNIGCHVTRHKSEIIK